LFLFFSLQFHNFSLNDFFCKIVESISLITTKKFTEKLNITTFFMIEEILLKIHKQIVLQGIIFTPFFLITFSLIIFSIKFQ
jgi:uncharacterized membrane protein YozB (DUF420 family)